MSSAVRRPLKAVRSCRPPCAIHGPLCAIRLPPSAVRLSSCDRIDNFTARPRPFKYQCILLGRTQPPTTAYQISMPPTGGATTQATETKQATRREHALSISMPHAVGTPPDGSTQPGAQARPRPIKYQGRPLGGAPKTVELHQAPRRDHGLSNIDGGRWGAAPQNAGSSQSLRRDHGLSNINTAHWGAPPVDRTQPGA